MHNVRSNHVAAPSLVGRDDPIAPFAADESGRAACPHAAAPWPKVRLGEIADFIQTGPFGSQLHQHDYSEIGTPVVMPKDLICGYISETTIARVSEDHVGRLSRHKVKPGDFLFSRRGDVGRCALVREKESGWLCGTGCLRVGIKHELADSQFLLYNFSQHDIVSWLEGHAVGATMPNINPAILSDLPFSLPPLPIQRRIASVLGAYDDLIENNRRRIALLEKMARELYRERFVRRSGKGNTVRIIDICTRIGSGGTPNRKSSEYWGKGAIRWFKTKELCDGWLIDSEESISEDGLKNSAAKLFPPHSILMAIYAAPTVGRLGVLSQTATSNQAALALVVDESKVSWQWLFQKLYEHRDHFNKIAAGAGQQNISGEIVKQHEVKLPSKVEIDDYTCRVSQMWDEMLNLALQNRSLSRQRDILLPRLMSGKIDVEALVKEEERHG